MKTRFLRAILLVSAFLQASNVNAQEQFTPYDELPSIIKSYKPSYSDDLPDWAKLMYYYPLNYNVIKEKYNKYIALNPHEKSAAIRYFKIWSRAVESCVKADGTILLPDLSVYNQNLVQTRSQILQNRDLSTTIESEWSFLGPKETFWLNETGSASSPASCPWQVNVYSLDVAASDNNILYCGTETGFVNKSIDKGLTWSLVAQDYPFGGGVTAVAIDQANAEKVYVAAGNQIHRSVDGGNTWTPLLTSPNIFYADRLKIDDQNTLKLFAASSNGVFVTSDGGSSWVKKWSAPAYDVEIAPNNHDHIFALSKASGKFSVIQSLDGGNTFQTMTGFPTNIPESSGGLLAMTPDNPNIILAILLSSNNTPYMVKGQLSGSIWNWSLLATGGTGAFPMDNGQGYFDLALEISPVNENTILVGTTTLFKSTNAGASFSVVGGYWGDYSIHPDIQDIKMLSNGETWVSTDGGMNFTTDNFSSQQAYSVRINGLTGSDMWGFDQGWNEDVIVGGRYHNGNTALADFYQPKALRMGGAESPTGWVLQGKNRHVAFDDLGNGWILPQTAEGMPEGRFIFSKYPNMDEYGGRRSNLIHHPNYYGTLFLGQGNGFWRSHDAGITWDLLHAFPGRVRYVQMSYSNPSVIYADVVGLGLCKSENGGVTWVTKPSLTAPPNGNSGWKGNLFFAVSPKNENVIYACLQNGTWSADIGKVFRSADGGNTWSDWTGSLNEYMKCLIVQPSESGDDLVYLFSNSTNGKSAGVFYRTASMPDWQPFDANYPAGIMVNMALPFYRDGKLRVGCNNGVWESAMADTAFEPVINPWVEAPLTNCMLDTLLFDDHSILMHSGATWHWEITPEPAWIENPDMRNPRVVLGAEGSYSVSLTVTKNGQSYTRSIPEMIATTECPSIYKCSNPDEIPKNLWRLMYVDSEEVNYPGLASMSFDGNTETIWHTRWSTGDDPYPHEIQISLGDEYRIKQFTYLTRQDGENGRIKKYEFYISNDSLNWGVPVKIGEFENTAAPQSIDFDTLITGRYIRLVALSEVNGNPWASAAEFSVTACVTSQVGLILQAKADLVAFPVPATAMVNIPLSESGDYKYEVYNTSGSVVGKGFVAGNEASLFLDVSEYSTGIYLLVLTDKSGINYRIKIIKQ